MPAGLRPGHTLNLTRAALGMPLDSVNPDRALARDLIRFNPPEAGAILDRGHAKTSAEDDSHPVRRPEAAIECDRLHRPVASFQHHARRVNAGTLDELVRSDPGRLHEMSDQIPGA